MGWWTTAKPGDEIICVQDGWASGSTLPCPLVLGEKYVVEGFEIIVGRGLDRILRERTCVVLIGVRNPNLASNGFDPIRFRPVQPTKRTTETGMTTLRGILNGQPIREDA